MIPAFSHLQINKDLFKSVQIRVQKTPTDFTDSQGFNIVLS
ncbi:hypothetical protein SAMN05421876_11184 [Kaistella jeonii]|nr:hypothetical protein SAMN05421876_11184 [Kaistella jeonii]VEI95727.1 Uncharacterised protein [Kaistella jeonii]